MTRPFIHRVLPRFKAIVATRPLFARKRVPRQPAVFVIPPSDPWADPTIRPYLWTGLGVACVGFGLIEYFYPSPPSADALLLAVSAKVALDALKGRLNPVAPSNVNRVKPGNATGHAIKTPVKPVEASTPRTNQQKSELVQKAIKLLLERKGKGGGRRKRRRLRRRK